MIRRTHRRIRLALGLAFVLAVSSGPAPGQSFVVGWGPQAFDSLLDDETFVGVIAGDSPLAGRRASDGC